MNDPVGTTENCDTGTVSNEAATTSMLDLEWHLVWAELQEKPCMVCPDVGPPLASNGTHGSL